jgi:hypothetical protein
MGSFVHVFEHPLPSPLNRPLGPVQPVGTFVGSVPQSQDSPVSLTPLPQIDFVQTLGAPTQVHPGSTPQLAEHPSPLVVLPSSHCLPSSTLPSPQMRMHAFPGTGHCQPGSILWQSPAHPSPLVVLPSSHTLLDVSLPLPHTPR